MFGIPRAPLLLGILGLVPFLIGAFVNLGPFFEEPVAFQGNNGHEILGQYGVVILCFMSGVLWGFAVRAPAGEAGIFFALSVLPALYVFLFATDHFFALNSSRNFLKALFVGFIGLLVLDWVFWKNALAPAWWMRLRVGLTTVVCTCLGTAILG